MDSISKIALFLEVAKQKSFAKAARQLGMTGPALSKQVQSLEERLGVRLLHRTTRQVSLTEEGALYSERARRALEDLDNAEREIQDLTACPTGELKINAPMSFGLAYLVKPLTRFAQAYPDLRLDIDFDDRQVDIVGEGYDLVIRIDALADSSMIAREIKPCPITLCAGRPLIERLGMPDSLEALATYPAVIYTKHGRTNEWRYQSPAGEQGVLLLNRVMSANTADMMVEACRQGVGVALLPSFSIARLRKEGELIPLLPEYETWPQRNIYAIYPERRFLSTKVKLLIEWLRTESEQWPF